MDSKSGKITALFLLLILIASCDKFEMRGFILSYESANERFEQSKEWNKTNPFRNIDVATDEYTLFVMADSHVGGTENLDLFLSNARQANAAAAVMVGDLTSGHAADLLTFKQHLPHQDTFPTFQITGNHDLYFDGWKQFYALFGSSSYYFTMTTPAGSDLYICLDSGSGTLGSMQLQWLKQLLEDSRNDYRFCNIFTHNNLFRIRHTASTNPFVEEIRVLAELTVKHKINMVITGHDHIKNSVKFGSTTHITMDALLDGFKKAGYFVINANQGSLDYQFVNL